MRYFLQGLRRDLNPILFVALFYICASLVRWKLDLPPIPLSSVITNFILVTLGIVVIVSVWQIAKFIQHKPESPINYLQTDPEMIAARQNFIGVTPILLALIFFYPAFSTAKSLVGVLAPYSWDQAFVDWDAYLHGGHAWELLHPMLGFPLVSFSINLIYHLWLLFLYLAFPLVCLASKLGALRQQMIIAYFLCWVLLGGLAANYFASVGPAFMEGVLHDQTFRPLMQYLQSADTLYPIWVLDVQDRLLQLQNTGDGGLGSGISAMPSMHVSIAFLFTIFSWRVSKRLGATLTTIFLIVLLGSVHLAYHYAIDGYLSIAMTLGIWWLSGYIVKQNQSGFATRFRPKPNTDQIVQKHRHQ